MLMAGWLAGVLVSAPPLVRRPVQLDTCPSYEEFRQRAYDRLEAKLLYLLRPQARRQADQEKAFCEEVRDSLRILLSQPDFADLARRGGFEDSLDSLPWTDSDHPHPAPARGAAWVALRVLAPDVRRNGTSLEARARVRAWVASGADQPPLVSEGYAEGFHGSGGAAQGIGQRATWILHGLADQGHLRAPVTGYRADSSWRGRRLLVAASGAVRPLERLVWAGNPPAGEGWALVRSQTGDGDSLEAWLVGGELPGRDQPLARRPPGAWWEVRVVLADGPANLEGPGDASVVRPPGLEWGLEGGPRWPLGGAVIHGGVVGRLSGWSSRTGTDSGAFLVGDGWQVGVGPTLEARIQWCRWFARLASQAILWTSSYEHVGSARRLVREGVSLELGAGLLYAWKPGVAFGGGVGREVLGGPGDWQVQSDAWPWHRAGSIAPSLREKAPWRWSLQLCLGPTL